MLFGFESLPFDHQLLAEARSLSGEDKKRFYAVEVYQALRNFRILFNEKRTIFITIQSQRDQEKIVLIIEIIAVILMHTKVSKFHIHYYLLKITLYRFGCKKNSIK